MTATNVHVRSDGTRKVELPNGQTWDVTKEPSGHAWAHLRMPVKPVRGPYKSPGEAVAALIADYEGWLADEG